MSKRSTAALPIALLTAAAAGLLALLLFLHPHSLPRDPDCLQIWFLDVGQGDAALLTQGSHAVLIDAGEPDQGARICQMLRQIGVTRLDFAVNSHPHSDHLGGLRTVLTHIPAPAVYLPQFPDALTPTAQFFADFLDFTAQQQIPVIAPACGSSVPIGEAALTFLCADNSGYDGLNDCSLCCLVTYGQQRFFFGGDLEDAGESALLEAGLIPDITLLKLSHHGSSSSSGEAFLAAAHPAYAVVSCGADNSYGHPSEKTLHRLAEAGCAVWRTDLDGTVCVTADGSQLSVTAHALT